MITIHPNYSNIASSILIMKLHKSLKFTFSETMSYFHSNGLIADHYMKYIKKHATHFDSMIKFEYDFSFNYFGIKTLLKNYLLRFGDVMETPQFMFMRVAISIWIGYDVYDDIKQVYCDLAQGLYIHASPTLFSACTKKQQMASCFLLSVESDSIDGIFSTLKKCAIISQSAGGIGLNVSNIRATNAQISCTAGVSSGIIPMLKIFDATAHYVDQGGKRPGSIAVYLEPWHPDIFDFLLLKRNSGGVEENKTRNLFLGLWIPDIFMRRVEEDGDWCLMCPNKNPLLYDTYGESFEKIYIDIENSKNFVKKVKARDLFKAILISQVETGVPYMLYKDTCNRRSNQNNLGTIRGSNLCTEIIQYTNSKEIAVCNLGSIALNKCVENGVFNFYKLQLRVRSLTENLNSIINKNNYPVKEAKYSNLQNRPLGIGVQGLADTFAILRYPFDSDEARELNKLIFETIYYTALDSSVGLAFTFGAPYPSYHQNGGCLVSRGILHFDTSKQQCTLSGLYDWDSLREKIKKYGIRNSLLVAPMPTASTSQILGNNESFEPFTSNIYSRGTLSGSFQMINKYLVAELEGLGIWNVDLKNKIILENGSIQNIKEIPADIKALFKTSWEMSQKKLIDMAIDRSHFIDQSQSLNIHMLEPNYNKLSSMHFYAWKNGLKTGLYYLRTKPSVQPTQFSIDISTVKNAKEMSDCNDDVCISCSS
ncbi:ribonucleoside-diphosphate reductase large subunit-like [Aphidius gifuensis]|uniref:ribonucleoside-diphosphate reductase large subunit-like n=1 Tax=Aphidius gifuensis TaxID=684658 RepID=UPI001CDD3627|nr:ribonucleoside-diphosphate reductase large subunit-like [Aphidius gifuensis]